MCVECGRYHGTDKCVVCGHSFDSHDNSLTMKCMVGGCGCPTFVWEHGAHPAVTPGAPDRSPADA